MPDTFGSSRLVTDASQSIQATYTFDAFGNVISQSGVANNPYRFGGIWGYRNHGDAGLLLLGARYYDPEVGRFITADPMLGNRLNPQSLNRYPYVENNPVNAVDPTGKWLVGGLQSCALMDSMHHPPLSKGESTIEIDYVLCSLVTVLVLILIFVKEKGKPIWKIPWVIDVYISLFIALLLLVAVNILTPPDAYLQQLFGRLGRYVFYTILLFAGCGPIGWLLWRASRRLRAAGLPWPSAVASIGTIAAWATPFVHWLKILN